MQILWYDFETSGRDPAADRAVQVGWVKTDPGMELLDDEQSLFIQVPDDVIPSPNALLVHQIPPEVHQTQGITEAELACRLEALMQPKTLTAGYNSRRFDDRFTQHIFYRCLRDPFTWQWSQGRGRFDLYPVVLTYYGVAPDAIIWPEDGDGRPRLKLDRIGPLNRFDQGLVRAHDALSDVNVTVRLARQLAHYNPDLFADCLRRIDKHYVIDLIRANGRTDGLIEFTSLAGWESGFARDLWIPFCLAEKSNDYVGFNLDIAPEDILVGLQEIILKPLEKRRSLLGTCGLHIVRVNAQPMLFRRDELSENTLKRLADFGRDVEKQNRHRDFWHHIQNSPAFKDLYQTVLKVLEEAAQEADPDVDYGLYTGRFLSSGDRSRLEHLTLLEPDKLSIFSGSFDDPRYDELLFRYRARNFPASLSQGEWRRWQLVRKSKLSRDDSKALTATKIRDELLQLAERTDLEPVQLDLIRNYVVWLDALAPI